MQAAAEVMTGQQFTAENMDFAQPTLHPGHAN